jgi:hypothetical protein
MKKKILFIMIFFIFCINSFVFANDFDIETEAGINSYVIKADSYNFKIKVLSHKDFEGQITLSIPTRADNSIKNTRITYSENVNLVNGETYELNFEVGNIKTRYNHNNQSNVIYSLMHKITFIDNNNKLIYEDSFHPKYEIINNDIFLIGALTDDIDGLTYLPTALTVDSVVTTGTVITNVSTLSNERQLKMLDAIVIDNYNVEKLSNAQLELLKSFVQKGGTILIGTGINDKKILEKLLDIKTGDLEEIGNNDFNLSPNLKRVEIAEDKLEVIEKDLVYKINDNKGKYIIFTFSLSDENFVENSKSNAFLKSINNNMLINFDKTTNNANQNGNYYNRNMSDIPMDSLPNLKLIIYGFLVFILLIGPINYIVLKKMNKSNLLLVTITVTSVLFIVIINFMSSNSILKNDYANINTILEIGEGITIEESDVAVKFKSGNNSIQLPEGDLIISDSLENQNTEILNVLSNEDNKVVTFNNISNWEFKVIELSRKMNNEFGKVILNIDKNGNINSKLKNIYGTDIYDLKLYVNGEYYEIGDWLINEEKEIKYSKNTHGNMRMNSSELDYQFEQKITNRIFDSGYSYLVGKTNNYNIDGLKVDGNIINSSNKTVVLIPVNMIYKENQKYSINVKDYFDVLSSQENASKYEKGGNGELWITGDIEFVGDKYYKNIEIESIDIKSNFYQNQNSEECKFYLYNYEIEDYELIKSLDINIAKEDKEKYLRDKLRIKVVPNNEFHFEFPEVIINGVAKNDQNK